MGLSKRQNAKISDQHPAVWLSGSLCHVIEKIVHAWLITPWNRTIGLLR
jgi:hypothetical protein